jgi:hypothetical protein
MAHGYLGDGYGKDGWRDPNDGGDKDRGDDGRGSWRGQQQGDWRERPYGRDNRDEGSREGGGFMFEGRDRDWGSGRDQSPDHGNDRGLFSRTADEARDWFREDEHDYRPSSRERGGSRWSGADRHESGRPGDQRSAFSSHQDDHYLSWRQQQMDALDRDYQDYCRERQQQFHSDFDSWRRNRQSGQQGSGKQAEELELSERNELAGTTAPHTAPQATVSPEGDATLGTNNPENSVKGRG